MNLFTDAYYRCACGRLSLCRVCPLCFAQPVDMRGFGAMDEESKRKLLRTLQVRVGVDVDLLDALDVKQAAPEVPLPEPWPEGIEWNECGRCCLSSEMGIAIWIGREYLQMWEVWCSYEQFKYGTFYECAEAEAEAEKYRAERRAALRSVIEEAKVTYAEAGVFDVYQEFAGAAWGLLFFAQATDEPLKTLDAEPLYRVRRIPESIKERWREVPLLPLVTKREEASVS